MPVPFAPEHDLEYIPRPQIPATLPGRGVGIDRAVVTQTPQVVNGVSERCAIPFGGPSSRPSGQSPGIVEKGRCLAPAFFRVHGPSHVPSLINSSVPI